jgi:hypothetical protein
MKLVMMFLILSSQAFAQANNPCLIVKQNKGHRIRNTFLFGAPGLFSRGERFEYVDAFNVPNSRMKYKGDELQKIKDSGVHVIVVSEGSDAEIQAARASCQGSPTPQGTTTTAAKDCSKNPAECWWPKPHQ